MQRDAAEAAAAAAAQQQQHQQQEAEAKLLHVTNPISCARVQSAPTTTRLLLLIFIIQ
jgi:hypothetical protein